MAKIPILSGSSRVRSADPLNPTLSPNEAGAPFRQQAKIAENISAGLQTMRRKQIAEADKVAYTKSNIALSQSFNEVEKQVTEEYRANRPDHEGYAKDAMERLNVSKTFLMESAPESAKAQIGLAFEQKMAGMQERFESQEAAGKSQYAYTETKGLIGDAGSASYSAYSPLDMLENSTRLKGLVGTSSKFSGKEKAVLNNKIGGLSKNMLDGVIDREDPVEMRRALSDMDSEDLAPVFDSMDPKDVTKTKARLKRKLQYKETEGKQEVNRKYSDAVSGLQSGTLSPSNPQHQKILGNVKNELLIRLGEKGKSKIDQIEAYEAASEIASDEAFNINNLDVDSKSAEIASDQVDPLARAGSQGRVKNILNSMKSSMQKAFKKDPASYIMNNDSNISLKAQAMISSNDPAIFKEYLDSMDSRYNEMNTPLHQRQYVSKPLKEHYGGSIKKFIDSGDHQSAAAVLNELSAKSSGEFYRFYDELDIPKKYAAVSEIQSPDARTRAVRNLMNEKEDINPRFEKHSNHSSDADIRDSLRKDDMYMSVIGQDAKSNPNSGKNAEAMVQMAQVEYKLAILNGADMDEAKEQAWSKIKEGYDIIPNGEFPIAVNNKKHDSNKTRLFIESHTKQDMDYVNKFNIKVNDKSSMEATNSQYEDGSSWTYNRKSDSIRLVVYNKNQARWEQAMNMDNQPVSMKLSDIDKIEDMTESDSLLKSRRKIFEVGGGIVP